MKKHLTVLIVLVFMTLIKNTLSGGHTSWYRSSSGRSTMRSSVRLHGGRQFTSSSSSSSSSSSICGGAYLSMSGMRGSTGKDVFDAMVSSRRYTDMTPPESSEEQRTTNSNERTCSLNDCLPYIKTEETIELSWSQKREAFCKRPFIDTWRDTGKLLDASSTVLHTSIVTLNSEQKSKILSRYGNYFHGPDRLPPIPSTTVPQHREKRNSNINVCPRVELWDPLVLALTDDDELIQVIQIPEDDATQWILKERCAQTVCNFVSSCECTHHTRLVRATVISFDQSQVVERYIKVYCCIAQILI